MSEREEVPIFRRRGGYFVEFPTGFSGPWATLEAAELARAGDYIEAHEAERKARR